MAALAVGDEIQEVVLLGLQHGGQAGAPRVVDRCRRQAGIGIGVPRRVLPEIGAGQRPLLFRRSEEHTSELQSLMRISYAVFCLKKKTIKQYLQTTKHRLHSTNPNSRQRLT